MPITQACACRFVMLDGWLRLLPETECGYHRALRSTPLTGAASRTDNLVHLLTAALAEAERIRGCEEERGR